MAEQSEATEDRTVVVEEVEEGGGPEFVNTDSISGLLQQVIRKVTKSKKLSELDKLAKEETEFLTEFLSKLIVKGYSGPNAKRLTADGDMFLDEADKKLLRSLGVLPEGGQNNRGDLTEIKAN